ncbi:MAG: hypothetical protein ABEI52_03460, partial [Halobacteriaceae archaeon]
MVEAPQTAEGWFILHDFREIDWDAWRETPQKERETALEEAIEHLKDREALSDADEGGSGIFTILGHQADLLLLHFRPTLDDINRLERAGVAG